MRSTVKIHGLKELDSVLANELSKATARNVLRRALLSAAEPMAAKARSLAPDDPNTIDLDKELKESIVVSTKAHPLPEKDAFSAAMRAGETRAGAASALRAVQKEQAHVRAFLGPKRKVFHGIFQEFGTSHHAPQAFLRPAFDSDKDALMQRLRVELADEINKAVARARAKAARAAAKG